MNKKIAIRVISESNYILNYGHTIRQIAKIFNVSKSTVHKDLSERLLTLDQAMFEDVTKILKYHTDVRHIRGGMSTKQKYQKLNN